MYKISSKHLNGYEIQDLVDKIEGVYKEVKEKNEIRFTKKISFTIAIIPEEEREYPHLREVGFYRD